MKLVFFTAKTDRIEFEQSFAPIFIIKHCLIESQQTGEPDRQKSHLFV